MTIAKLREQLHSDKLHQLRMRWEIENVIDAAYDLPWLIEVASVADKLLDVAEAAKRVEQSWNQLDLERLQRALAALEADDDE